MFARIPPHIFWPGMVVSILGLSVTANAIMLIKANGDNGAQVIDNYYVKAASWDENKAKIATSKALHWTHKVEVLPLTIPNAGYVRVTLSDAQGPLENLVVNVTLRDPSKVTVVASSQASHEGGGVYILPVPMKRHGLWDVDVHATQGTTVFEERVRVESVL